MRVGRVHGSGGPRRLAGPRTRRFEKGQRVTARVLRSIAGPLVVMSVEGRRLVAWLEKDVMPSEELYLEVTSVAPMPRFRMLTGGASFWSLPVGEVGADEIDLNA